MKNSISLVQFQLDKSQFALPLQSIENIVQVVEISPLPNMPDHILGIINLHGTIVPVINLRILFRLPTKQIELSDQLIIVNTSSHKHALLVDSTSKVLELEKDNIIETDQIINEIQYVNGVGKLNGDIILINDVDLFLNPDEIESLTNAINKLKSRSS